MVDPRSGGHTHKQWTRALRQGRERTSKSSGQTWQEVPQRAYHMHSGLPHNRRLRASVSFSLGNNHALVALKNAYRAGCVGKEDIAAALRARQAACDRKSSEEGSCRI
eukprot:scaffold34578_cov89-Skeletonema_dohrnii-CCMP3373.AAC.1